MLQQYGYAELDEEADYDRDASAHRGNRENRPLSPKLRKIRFSASGTKLLARSTAKGWRSKCSKMSCGRSISYTKT